MSSSLRIIVSGLIVQYPLGGVTWDYLQYVVGLKRLGHDVYYLEDTGLWPYHPGEDGLAREPTYHVAYLSEIMSRYGLGDRWAYCFPHETQWFGLPDVDRATLLESADLLINVSCALQRPSRFGHIGRTALIDTDPVFTQVKLARGQNDFRTAVDAHDIHFSYGECLPGATPETGHRWHPMRKPILLSEWTPLAPHRDVYTTVMNWTSFNDLTFNGQRYGQKDAEFVHFFDLPGKVAPAVLEMAVGAGKTRRVPRDLLVHKGWRVVDPSDVCASFDAYRDYIEGSKAEWTVAKQGYVVGQSGWFSGRSACYLAAGRPTVVQDTGFGPVLPCGEGILAFRTFEEAVDAIRRVEDDYQRHAVAARSIAETYFDSDKVLSRLVAVAMNGHSGGGP